mmetsp:Transcript_9599/g.17315  ORF Transcript_9599/g.17315 Transcript_9599/m.17315 type:complete len:93 (+) Transcript_9599:944-1222(+)
MDAIDAAYPSRTARAALAETPPNCFNAMATTAEICQFAPTRWQKEKERSEARAMRCRRGGLSKFETEMKIEIWPAVQRRRKLLILFSYLRQN